ncbi:MAG: glycosyltransferase family 4 protein [Flavobacteriales bacterium]
MKTNKPKLLLISYYWPPSGGAGVQRWLKFSKYLSHLGWDITVYCPENPEYPSIDHSLEKDLHPSIKTLKTTIWEPYSWYKRFTGSKKGENVNAGFLSESEKPKKMELLSRWIRGNFFIPDARKFWIKPSIKFLSSELAKTPVDAIVSTGPPHSMHLIAKGVADATNTPWLADFRDPWTNIDFYEDLMLTKSADKKHHRLEKLVCDSADALLVIGQTMKKEFEIISPKSRIYVVPNGYDPSDQLNTQNVELDSKFSIAHIGSFSPSRNVPVLWNVLAELCEEDPLFKEKLIIKLVGKVDHQVLTSIAKVGLENKIEKIPYLQHEEVIAVQKASQLLLLVANNTKNAKGILTGKVFEYLAADRPILTIGPEDGDLAHLLKKVNAAGAIDYENKSAMKTSVRKFFQLYQQKALHAEHENISSFSREKMSQQIDLILNELISAK